MKARVEKLELVVLEPMSPTQEKEQLFNVMPIFHNKPNMQGESAASVAVTVCTTQSESSLASRFSADNKRSGRVGSLELPAPVALWETATIILSTGERLEVGSFLLKMEVHEWGDEAEL